MGTIFVNGARIHQGRNWEKATENELTERQYRAIFQQGGDMDLLLRNSSSGWVTYVVWRPLTRGADVYTISPDTMDMCYVCTVTRTGEKLYS